MVLSETPGIGEEQSTFVMQNGGNKPQVVHLKGLFAYLLQSTNVNLSQLLILISLTCKWHP